MVLKEETMSDKEMDAIAAARKVAADARLARNAEGIAALAEALKTAPKTTEMVTVYEIGKDGPVVDGYNDSERIRVDRVVVKTDDRGYVQVEVKGKSVTKTGKDKSTYSYFSAPYEITKAVQDALLDL